MELGIPRNSLNNARKMPESPVNLNLMEAAYNCQLSYYLYRVFRVANTDLCDTVSTAVRDHALLSGPYFRKIGRCLHYFNYWSL